MVDYPAGWTCERTKLQFEHYLLSTLPLGDALAVAEHLEGATGVGRASCSIASRSSNVLVADRIIAFAGSLRRGSFNRALIHAAQKLAPDGMTIEPIEIGTSTSFSSSSM